MAIDLPGFADPVADSQACFRAVLDALARPGSVHAVGAGLTPPAPLGRAAAAVLLTLVDPETTLWLDPALQEADDWIRFHCGVVIVPAPAAADFVLAVELPELATLKSGTDDAPEQSATVILQPRAGAGGVFELAGPGLAAPRRCDIAGVPPGFAAAWAANHALFPRGIDLLICRDGELRALPRSTTVREG